MAVEDEASNLTESSKKPDMHGMAGGHEAQKTSHEHKTHEMGEPSKPIKHRGRHEGHVTEDFKEDS